MPDSCRNPAPKPHFRVHFLRALLVPNLLIQLSWETDSKGNLSAQSLLRRVLGIDTSGGMKKVGVDKEKS